MSAPLLVVDQLVAGYVRGLPIVHGVSITVSPREVVTVIGPNGAGKSTLLKAIVGLVAVESGQVTLAGRNITGLPAHEVIQAGVGFVPQTANVFTTLTVEENLRAGGHLVHGQSGGRKGSGQGPGTAPGEASGTGSKALLAQRMQRAYTMFPVLGEKRHERARTLSGGQRQMLAMARAMMTEPALMVLDEPTAGLSPLLVDEVFTRVRELAEHGVAVLMVEQNAKGALRRSDRGYVLAEGRNRVEGEAASLLLNPEVSAAFLGGHRPQTSKGAAA